MKKLSYFYNFVYIQIITNKILNQDYFLYDYMQIPLYRTHNQTVHKQ